MEHFIAIPQEGHTRAVDFVELSQLTQTGWMLVGVLDVQEVIDVDEPIPFPEVQAEHIKKQEVYRYIEGHNQFATWKKKVVVTTKRYLVRQSGDATHDSLVTQLSSAEHRADEAERLLGWSRSDLATAKAEVAKLETERAELAKKYDEHSKALFTAQRTQAKLEADIAKIRTDIGESRMKKILAGKDGE